jgi:hypothetical protein
MNDSFSNPSSEDQFDGCDSRDCIDVVIDLVGDNTVRPPRPEYVKWAMAQRERRARLMELWKQQQEQEKAKGAPDTGNEQPG